MATIHIGLLLGLIGHSWGLPSSTLTIHPLKPLVERGGSIQLTCSMDCPGGKVQWEGLDTDLGDIVSNHTHSVLTVTNAAISMEGMKICTGQCRRASYQSRVELQVYSFPDNLQLDSQPETLTAGQPGHLICSLRQVYPPGALTLSWFRGVERLAASEEEEEMEDSQEQLFAYRSVLEVPTAMEHAAYKCTATLQVELHAFRQERLAIVSTQTTQMPSTTAEAAFIFKMESTSHVATPEPATTSGSHSSLVAITSGLPLLIPTEHPTTVVAPTAPPTLEPLPQTSSHSPAKNHMQTRPQKSVTGANTKWIPTSTLSPSAETLAKLRATSQASHSTDRQTATQPVSNNNVRLIEVATEKLRSSTFLSPMLSKNHCRPVISPSPAQGTTGDALQITCHAVGCSEDVQIRWVETPVDQSRYHQEEAEGRSTLMVQSVDVEHQGVYRCVVMASRPQIASLRVVVSDGAFSTDSIIAIGTAGSLLGLIVTGYVSHRLKRRGG
ncbi:mucosal addressin cell adhesion molecule 1 isoform X2 [Rhineura floridana]|uniref:mucosal addressin cell adhesion molecule 1 isoform X2 n=1 Tax=Rhineura floridana TaxID=261503 RepID=UPI002AC861CF|nr:mucosal addressin cell adhesion molecule 1 isoform X2 [Rhineura floridana]